MTVRTLIAAGLTAVLLIAAPSAHAQFGESGDPALAWRLIYANTPEGETAYGDKRALIDAVRSGYPVRVGWGGGPVEHVVGAGFLTIAGGEVVAQIEPILTQTPLRGEGGVGFRDGSSTWRALLSTSGRFENVVSGATPSVGKMHVYWYSTAPTNAGSATSSLARPPSFPY